MKCEELLKALNDYVDGDIDPAVCDEFAEHLAGCNPCQVVVDNIRQTITLYKAGEPYPMPAEFQQRLRQLLRERWAPSSQVAGSSGLSHVFDGTLSVACFPGIHSSKDYATTDGHLAVTTLLLTDQ